MAISKDTRLIKVHINIRIYKQELLDTWEYSSVTLGEQLSFRSSGSLEASGKEDLSPILFLSNLSTLHC